MANRPASTLLSLALGLLAPDAGAQAAPATVRVGYFSTSLPLMAAQSNGYFADENIALGTFQVRSSVQMFQRVRDRLMDVAISSPDNPVNYRLNAHNAVGEPLDVTMLFGGDLGLQLSLVSRAPFPSFDDLRGKRIGVDAPDSGFAYVLYEILRQHGLETPRDYTLVIVGGTPLRLNALRAGTIDATLLNADSVVRARNEGMNVLAPVSDVASPYLGTVASVRESWLAANPGVAVGFVRAYRRGQAWALDPANHDAAIAMLRTLPPQSSVCSDVDRLCSALLRRNFRVGPSAPSFCAALRYARARCVLPAKSSMRPFSSVSSFTVARASARDPRSLLTAIVPNTAETTNANSETVTTARWRRRKRLKRSKREYTCASTRRPVWNRLSSSASSRAEG